MIPLMMQQGFRPTGWLGLILGTKMYHRFFASAVDTDEKFLRQVDTLLIPHTAHHIKRSSCGRSARCCARWATAAG